MNLQSIIASYEFDIADLEQDINNHGSTPAANRTLKRLKLKLRTLRQQSGNR
jgi:hypothetical protein